MPTTPNFIVLGPPRTATTWLFRCLNNHPEVYVPNIKETRFFDENFDNGLTWYHSLYADKSEHTKVIGDITPGYFAHPQTPARIHDALGANVKLIIIFRDPVERALSHFKILKKMNPEIGSFEQHLKDGSTAYEYSLYGKHLLRYIEMFGESNICLLSYDELILDPDKYWRKVQHCLGLTAHPEALTLDHVNASSGKLKSPVLAKAVHYKEKIEQYKLVRKILWFVRDIGLMKLIHKTIRTETTQNKLEQSERENLFEEYFADDAKLLNKLSHLYIQL